MPLVEARADRSIGNVIVITFDFPPRRTSATYRLGNLVRHLLAANWRPTVLTIDIRPEQLQEPEQFEKLPRDTRIERTRYWRIGSWENAAHSTVKAMGKLEAPGTKSPPSLLDRFLRRTAAFVRSCLYFPDNTIGWVPFGFVRGWRLLRHSRFDAIFSSEPPRAASVIALLLKMTFRVPWIMEMMDPWYSPDRPIRRKVEHWFLGFMLRCADAVVVMTEGHSKDLQAQYRLSRRKIIVIPNGFDEDDFRDVVPSMAGATTEMCAPGYIHFSHFGTVYPNNSGQFFPALAELLRERPELRNRVRFHMVGFPDEKIRSFARDDGLRDDVVEFRNFIPAHAQVIREMYASHCLLLFWGDREFSRLAAAGKTYVYLRTGRPILAVTGSGTIRERIAEAGAGWVVDSQDVSAIKATLWRIIQDYEKQAAMPGARREYVEQFRWDRIAASLGRVLDEVVNRAR